VLEALIIQILQPQSKKEKKKAKKHSKEQFDIELVTQPFKLVTEIGVIIQLEATSLFTYLIV
jgi:hypothetical protein